MRKDIALAIAKMDANPSKKIQAREILANYEGKEVSSVCFWECSKTPLVITKETLRGKPLNVEFVEEISFFYGMEIQTVEQYGENPCEHYKDDNDWCQDWDQLDVDWSPVNVTYWSHEDLEDDKYCEFVDMVLINGRFWTYARNLPQILEMAI